MFSRLNRCAEQTNKAIDNYRYHEVAQTLWHFFWHEFCDWYVELKKLRLSEGSGLTDDWKNVLTAFETALRLLHPAMPFITEELWQRLAPESGDGTKSVALADYPQPREEWNDEQAEREMDLLQSVIVSARNLRAQLKLEPKEFLDATLYARDGAYGVAEQNTEAIEKLARLKLTLAEGKAPEKGVKRSTPEFDLVLDVPAAKVEALKKSLEREVGNLEKMAGNAKNQLANEKFVSRAPAHVVEEIRGKLADYEAQLEKSRATLAGLEQPHPVRSPE